MTLGPVLNPVDAIGELPVDDLVNRFLAAHDVRQVSRDAYRRRLRHFLSWCIQRQVHQPTRDTIIEYKRYLREEQYSPASEGAYLVAVRGFFAWAESVGAYPNIASLVSA